MLFEVDLWSEKNKVFTVTSDHSFHGKMGRIFNSASIYP